MSLENIFFGVKIVILALTIPSILVFILSVPFVPTPKQSIKKILDALELKDGMKVLELGCGNAQFLTLASKRAKIQAVGYELSPVVWMLGVLRNTLHRGKNVHILFQNYLSADISQIDVIFFYLLPARMPSILKKILAEGGTGTRIVSYAFEIKGLESKLTFTIPRGESPSPVYFYTL